MRYAVPYSWLLAETSMDGYVLAIFGGGACAFIILLQETQSERRNLPEQP